MNNIHIDHWLKRTDTDYYEMFIRAWIPFNAWYMRQYYDYDNKITSDRDILYIVKREDNPYKSILKNLLTGNTSESLEFKNHIHKLYNSLETITIPNENNRISFRRLKLYDNPKRDHVITFRKKTYKFDYMIEQPRSSKRFKCTIIKSNQNTEAIIELHKCSINELEINPTYLSLKDRIQKIIRDGFEEINPSKSSSIVSNNLRGIKISESLILKDNLNLAAEFFIEMLYQLRCKIFHGEIDPTQNYHEIYKQAYYIQKKLIKSLN